ncbi:glutathione-specific gamma-glutamylcyclotransferase 1-like [Mizuhopecten yessoensis]|uniref:glutathione-specific gamma-glutamylcyclotransferase n=1 Tax=Mizuhopecten yessoensis TaxID=6573 RepID=A0A210QRS2_MIZYE|nr:glutathione-specific gamma-glutamylcyclotransferase 1-like [Mizuhopecten yessoensis]OWF51447.1 Cation transport regulator-like protein 1 [Mizuhopecten yessoensis]
MRVYIGPANDDEIIVQLVDPYHTFCSSTANQSDYHRMKMDTLLGGLDHLDKKKTVWVFGYGSLMWNPNFNFQRKLTGHINGFVRRFWQGNTTHRGTLEKPGRVATLAKQHQGCVWGVAFQMVGVDQIREGLDYLYTREAVLGGYEAFVTKFHVRGTNDLPVDVLVFTATSSSHLYMGPADTNVMAEQIFNTRGQAGPNTDYVTNIADYIRKHIPEDNDDHLFSLDQTLRYLITSSGNSSASKNDCKVSVSKTEQEYITEIVKHSLSMSKAGTENRKKYDHSVPSEHYKDINVDLSLNAKSTKHFSLTTDIVTTEHYKLQTAQA